MTDHLTENARLRAALEEIADITERKKSFFPVDWQDQIAACSECRRYKGHPIQNGICDEHRRPIYAQEDYDRHETKVLGYRAQDIARAALATPAPDTRKEVMPDDEATLSHARPDTSPGVTAGAVQEADLLFDAYKGLLVLHRLLDKIGLAAGVKATNDLADRIVAAHPEFPARASLRAIAGDRT